MDIVTYSREVSRLKESHKKKVIAILAISTLCICFASLVFTQIGIHQGRKLGMYEERQQWIDNYEEQLRKHYQE